MFPRAYNCNVSSFNVSETAQLLPEPSQPILRLFPFQLLLVLDGPIALGFQCQAWRPLNRSRAFVYTHVLLRQPRLVETGSPPRCHFEQRGDCSLVIEAVAVTPARQQ